jgi:hypothetical protein
VAKFLGRDLTNMHVIHLNDIKTEEHRNKVKAEIKKLRKMLPAERSTIFLFASPRCLIEHKWIKWPIRMTNWNCLRLAAVDEVHLAIQTGKTFRQKEFKGIGPLLFKAPRRQEHSNVIHVRNNDQELRFRRMNITYY